MTATIFVFLESAPDTPLTGASPTLDYWDKSAPAAPVATGVAMTELVGGAGGAYFADIATADNKEYFAVVDGTTAAKQGGRFHVVEFSGTTDARIEADIPAILASLWTAAERNQIRFRLSLDGTQVDPTTDDGSIEDCLSRWGIGNQPTRYNDATAGTPGSIQSPDGGARLDVTVTQIDSNTVELDRQ